MKLTIKGKGPITLNDNDFVASGGFGKVYVKGAVAYKVYDDPSNAIPEAKIVELATLDRSNIIKPENILLDKNNHNVGYSMKAVGDSYTLCQLFPKPFRSRNNLTPDTVVKLVRTFQDGVKFVHSKNVLIVDLNEFNFLVDKKFEQVFFLDTDSYQTGSFPATALMESVRDRHNTNNVFTELTDWFSFAIVSFQMFRAIHPFKGTHPKISSLDERMLRNISILHNGVTYPQGAVLPNDVVPEVYQRWYNALFEQGKRLPPPEGLIASIAIITQVPQVRTLAGHLIDLIELDIFKYLPPLKGEALGLYRSGDNLVYKTSKEVCNQKTNFVLNQTTSFVGFTPKLNVPFAAWVDNQNKLVIKEIERGQPIKCDVFAEHLFETEGRIYYKYGSNICELTFLEVGNQISAYGTSVANVLEKATQIFQGCAIQNMLGTYFVSIFPHEKHHYRIRLKELSPQCKVVDAKYERNVLMMIVVEQGKYNKYIIKINQKYDGYVVRKEEDITPAGLNFVVLPNGICVSEAETSLEVFLNDVNNNGVKVVKDDNLASQGILLLRDHMKVIFNNPKDKKFYQIRLKN